MSGFCAAAGSVRVLAGKETVDIGLLVKNAKGPVCVPDYARPVPEGSGWQYSPALVGVLTQYKVPNYGHGADVRVRRCSWGMCRCFAHQWLTHDMP